jgi:hypothetical protein
MQSSKLLSFSIAMVVIAIFAKPLHAEIKDIPLPTDADGEVVYQFDTVTKLPRSARDERAEIMAVSFAILPKEPGAAAFWTMVYGIKFSDVVAPTSIQIEVTNKGFGAVELTDGQPTLTSSTWSSTSARHELTRQWFEKMTAKDPWFLQRKFTITYADGKKSILHQMAIITNTMRFRVLEKFLGESISEPSK